MLKKENIYSRPLSLPDAGSGTKTPSKGLPSKDRPRQKHLPLNVLFFQHIEGVSFTLCIFRAVYLRFKINVPYK